MCVTLISHENQTILKAMRQLLRHGQSAVTDLFQGVHPRESDILFGKNAFSNTRSIIALMGPI